MKQENREMLQDLRWIGKALAIYIPIILVATFLIVWGTFALLGVPLW